MEIIIKVCTRMEVPMVMESTIGEMEDTIMVILLRDCDMERANG